VIRTVKVKVFQPGNKRCITHRTIAGPRKYFTEAGIEKILEGYVEKVEAAAPGQYRMVQVAPAEFNFIHQGTELQRAKELAAVPTSAFPAA
jgi:hypothetical protein